MFNNYVLTGHEFTALCKILQAYTGRSSALLGMYGVANHQILILYLNSDCHRFALSDGVVLNDVLNQQLEGEWR